jgi:hypothetical protein
LTPGSEWRAETEPGKSKLFFEVVLGPFPAAGG